MPLQEIRLPHLDTYNFGVGVDRLSGTAMNQVVNPTPSAPLMAAGASQSFEVARISSTQDLQQKLGIDVSASYGCASFGAGVSGRFQFAQDSQVHSASLFMSVTASVHLADLSIADCVLTSSASAVADRPDIFTDRYGNMFLRACKRGGLFVGLLRVETFDETEATSIEAELRGSYGMFSADASTKFSKATSDHNASMYCTIYKEGGPAVVINDPTDPKQFLDAANAWITAMYAESDKYAEPYEWTLSPITIAEGPMPLNTADIQHAQDVLTFCTQQRAALLDQLNLLNWWSLHQDRYDWTGAATPAQVTQAATATQADLDTIAACASAAIDSPKDAVMPADYAAAHSKKYPAAQLPTPAPKPKPGAAAPVTTAAAPIPTPNFVGKHLDEARLIAKGANVTVDEGDLREFLENYTDRDGTVHRALPPNAITITAQDPAPGHLILPGGSVQLEGRP
ncbi:conserved hypothetical protein [Acidobacteriia bacterium SbA2]|nr:conserved hypothetical protein [Acidobacteriia bacterium SbA2]